MSDTEPDTGTETTALDRLLRPVPGGATTNASNTTYIDPGADMAAELEKWKSAARKHEDRAKANAAAAKELETFKQSTMSDTEKAVAAAKAEGRAEALRESAASRVEDAIRLAAAGRSVDVDALLEGLDTSRFATDDGEPDRKAIVAWVDRIAPQQDEQSQSLDLGQGVRTGSSMALNGDPLLRDLKAKLGIN